ncbi:MAG: phosphate ABC transporter substrate-binding protein PstS family protein [Methylococcales bacterium]|jgi:phosphate transport system substrate-binding protein|nr:phosphate ABC transporter substrate-binding protein PstS family protein [Methylococcales bacterium]
MKFQLLKSLSLCTAVMFAGSAQAAVGVDAGVPEYQRTNGVAGNLSSVGSDTLANLMTLWAEDFKKLYPSVNIQIQAAGSSTAPPALTESTSNLGPMSRKMKNKELEAFEKKFGYKPTAIPVAIDALAVFVNKDNPIKSLTVAQVDAIFSSTKKCGLKTDVKTWGDVGVKGSLESKNFQIYGRNSVSGTYGYFKKKALCKGDFKNSVNEQPGSASVVQSVATSLNGLGYSGIGYKTSGVKTVSLSKKVGKPFVDVTPENAVNNTYPLSRFLYVYVNMPPNKSLPAKEKEFLKMVLSQTGQKTVIKDGYIPLPSKVVAKFLKIIEAK